MQQCINNALPAKNEDKKVHFQTKISGYSSGSDYDHCHYNRARKDWPKKHIVNNMDKGDNNKKYIFIEDNEKEGGSGKHKVNTLLTCSLIRPPESKC